MKRNGEKIVLLPCNGREKYGIQRGHVFRIKEGFDLKNDGGEIYITLAEAEEKFPGDFFISGSDTLCPICSLLFEGEIGIKLVS